jgi:hypothetical protein
VAERGRGEIRNGAALKHEDQKNVRRWWWRGGCGEVEEEATGEPQN